MQVRPEKVGLDVAVIRRVRPAADADFERIHLKTRPVKRSDSWVARLADSAAAALHAAACFQRPRSLQSASTFPTRYNLRRSRKHGQAHARLLELCKDMSLSLFVRKALVCTT